MGTSWSGDCGDVDGIEFDADKLNDAMVGVIDDDDTRNGEMVRGGDECAA